MSRFLSASKSALLYLAIALAISFATGGRLWAQTQNATITGTATDSSGAAIVGAKIEAINEATNVVRSTVSDAQGRYTIAELPVGTYTVRASQSGFRTVSHAGVTLAVGSTVVVNLSLPVGEVSQTVSVESQVSRIETQSSSVSTLVSPKQMRELPLNGRNFEQLLALAPGVSTIAPAFNAVTGRLYGMMNNYSIAGSRPTGQMFLLDGTDIRDFWQHATGSGYAGTSLGVEAIGEFKVLTSSYSAQYGGNGAVMNAVSRSGTNSLHGGAYEFLRNSALDARDAPDIAAGLSSPPPFKRNQFGVAIGGPIKKNKIFFFGNYEGLREGLETTSPFNIPEPYVASGMLPCGQPGAPMETYNATTASYDPNTINSSATCTSLAQAGGSTAVWPLVSGNNTGGNPYLAIASPSPVVQNIAQVYSLCHSCSPITAVVNGVPYAPGTDLGGYYSVASKPNLITNEDYTLGRVDVNISSTDTMFARYVLDDARVQDNPRDPTGIFPELDFTRNQFLTIGENHIISPTMVNSLHFGYVRNNENSRVRPALTSAQLSAAGLTSDPLTFMTGSDPQPRQDGQFSVLPQTFVIGPDQNRPDTLIQSKFSGSEDLTWNHGGHSLKIGATVTRVQTNNVQTAYANGTLYFPNASEEANLQGSPAFAFAVGPGANNSTRYFREIEIHPYIQDDWKVTPQLTLNIGFRYDYDTLPVGWAYGNTPLTTIVGSYLPPVGPIAADPAVSPDAPFTPVKHVFASNPNAGNFEPRFGFAYSPFSDNKTAIRGGVGVFFDPTAARLWESGFIATPPAGFSFLLPGPGSPIFPNPFPTGVAPAGSASEFAGVSYQLAGGSPYQLQYNLNIQRQITPSTILTIGYVGSVSRHLWTQGDINPPMCFTYPNCTSLPQVPKSRPTVSDATYTVNTGGDIYSQGSCVVASQTSCYGSGPEFPYVVLPPPFNLEIQVNRINQANFGSMIQAYNQGASSYNSLQISLNHQFASNFTGQFNYTYSHCIDNGSFASSLEEWAQLQTDRYNPAYDYGNCNFDLRHNVSANALYTLPFKGNRLVEGWRFSTILGIHTGLPLNVYNGSVFDPANQGSEWASRANYSFAPGCHPNHIIDKAVSPGVIQWFDPSCYEAQAPGFLGNIQRNSLPGPGTISADISITKETKLTENLNMEFRAECFNCVNHFNPGGASPVSATVLGAINTPTSTDGQTGFSQSPSVTPRQIQFAVKFDF